MLKTGIRLALLGFVAATIGMQIYRCAAQPPFQSELPEGWSAVVCHASIRCPTCTTMERLTRQTLGHHPDFAFHTLNYEAPENRKIAENYGIATATVLLVERRGAEIRVENLVTPAWQTVGDEARFTEMLEERLEAFRLGQTTAERAEDSEELLEINTEFNWE